MMKHSVVVVGTGVSGLTCAKGLVGKFEDVIVVDKTRKRLGGRLKTFTSRENKKTNWDVGAQFFTVRSEEMAQETEKWKKQIWCKGFVGKPDPYPRYRGDVGMQSIVESLRDQVPYEIVMNKTLVAIHHHQDGQNFRLAFEDGDEWLAPHVVLSCPVPQALPLVKHLEHAEFERLKKVKYDKTISVQLLLNRPSRIPAPGGWQKPCENVHFICSNKQKGISEEEAITVHFDAAFSDKYFDLKDEEALKKLVYANVEKFLDIDSITSFDAFRWRYAIPSVEFGEKFLHCKFGEKSISFIGDSFGWRIEGSFLSGFHLGKLLSNL